MLIQVDEGAAINMTGIRSIGIREVKTAKKIYKGWFDYETVEEKHYNLEIQYINHAGQNATFNLTNIKKQEDAVKTKNSVLSQIKEVELEKLSGELENAIRNS